MLSVIMGTTAFNGKIAPHSGKVSQPLLSRDIYILPKLRNRVDPLARGLQGKLRLSKKAGLHSLTLKFDKT